MNKKYKILSVILIMMLFITSNISVAIVQASGIESRANICDGVKIKSFYSDGYTSAAITEDGELYCWGNNSVGTVGNGTFINQLTPVKILEDVREVFLSSGTSIAITTNGDLYCWGFNIWGQVGNGTTINQSTPIKILKNVMVFDADGSTFSAITTNGDLYRWGRNEGGELGNNSIINQLTPIKILENVKEFSSYAGVSGAITTNGDLYCWGLNWGGHVGNGTTENQLIPVKILENIKVCSIESEISGAITTNGDLYCWGRNVHGAVGNGTTNDQLTPVKVLENVKSVLINNNYTTAAVTTNGELYCWGDNEYGKVGNGTRDTQLTPVKVLSSVKCFTAYDTNKAITANGDLYCWGLNSYGQVGNGTTVNQLTPLKILENVKTVNKNSAITTNGDLYCWGYNTNGQVGNGTTDTQLTPYKVIFPKDTSIDSSVTLKATAKAVNAFLKKTLKDQKWADGKIDSISMDFTMKDKKYTFTPLNMDFAAGMPLSNLNYQAVIDTDSKTVKVLLGASKDGKSEIKQTTNVNSTSWGQQYQSVKKMYKDLTGFDAKTSRTTWNRFEKMKSELNHLKCDMFVNADMKITGFMEFSYSDDSRLSFKEGGIIEKVSVDTKFSSPVVAPWVYISLGLGVSEEGTLKVQVNDNVPELIASLELAAKASAKVTGQIPVIAKVEGMIDAELSATVANTDPKFTVDMTGDISLKATALAGIIEVYNNTWNYLDCQIYPEFKNNNDTEIASYNSTDEMLCTASGTERIVGAQSTKLSGTDFSEQNVYSQNEARLISLSNNRKLLLWLDDSRQKSNNNRTTLMYSVYDGSNWSNPEEVCNDGCFDGEFSYYVENDNTVYVVFQKGNMIFEDDTEYSDVVRNIDPYVTKFDGSTFSTPEKVRDDNNSYEDNFTITKNDSQLKVTYVEYPSDYLAGNSDTLNLMNTVNNGSEWADNMICEENSFISDYEYIGSRLYLELYNTDKGCYELYKSDNGNDELLKSLSKEVKLVSVGDKIYYVENDILNTLKADKISECQLPYGTDYKIITNGNSTKIVYEIINEDHSSALYSGDISDGTVGDTLIYRSESDYIKSYNGCIDENGNLDIATTLCTLNSDLSESNYSLNVIGREKNYSLASTYLYYDENNVVADKDLDLYYDVTNNGNENISSYNVVLYDESGNTLADSKVTTGIKVGESREEKLVYHIPKDFGEQSVYIQIQSVDGKKIYSKAETVIKHNDIEICNVQVKHMCNDYYNIECILKNNGYQNADNVAISFNSNGDDIIKETEIEHLNSGETCTASVELTADEYACISDKTLYCEVTSSLSESDYGNNSKTIDLNKTTADGIHNWVKDKKSGKYICSICGKKIEDDYSGDLKGLSLSLSDDIGLNLVMQLSDSLLIDKDNAYVEFTLEGSKKSTRVYLKDADKVNYNGADCYSFKYRVNAAEMTKKVNAVLHSNDWTGQTYSYSVYDYASKILAEPEGSEYKSSAPLIKAMLNYGGYAQTYFNEKTDALANKGLYNKTNDPVLTTNTTVSKDYNYAVFNNNMGVSFIGGSLVLNSGTDLKLYYSMDDKNMANNINVSVNGQNVAPEYDGNIMCIRVPDISISSFGDTYNVKISVNGKEINQKYSAMTYMYKALNAQNSNTKLNNVVKALYLYNEAAKQYSMEIE
mgnify:FL=1|jgi:fibronectin type III domain./regulator of chromosome condensation (RCC1) repeat